jgi:hypothetical protein
LSSQVGAVREHRQGVAFQRHLGKDIHDSVAIAIHTRLIAVSSCFLLPDYAYKLLQVSAAGDLCRIA